MLHWSMKKKIDVSRYIDDESDRRHVLLLMLKRMMLMPVSCRNKLFKMTALQTSFGMNNIALVHGCPEMP